MFVLAPRLGTPAHSHGAMMGAAAGTLLGVSDVANKALLHVAAGGPAALISSPWLSLRCSRACRLCGLRPRVPGARAVPVMACASTAANITAMLGGIAVFGESLSSDAALAGLQVSAFALLAGTALLTVSVHGRVAVGAAAVTRELGRRPPAAGLRLSPKGTPRASATPSNGGLITRAPLAFVSAPSHPRRLGGPGT
jgi:hypothetical protein